MKVEITRHNGGRPIMVGVLDIPDIHIADIDIDAVANECGGMADLCAMATESTVPDGYEWTGDECYEIMPQVQQSGNGYYTADAEYVVGRTHDGFRVTRGDGDYAVFATEDEAHAAAQSLASGEASDADYEWQR